MHLIFLLTKLEEYIVSELNLFSISLVDLKAIQPFSKLLLMRKIVSAISTDVLFRNLSLLILIIENARSTLALEKGKLIKAKTNLGYMSKSFVFRLR